MVGRDHPKAKNHSGQRTIYCMNRLIWVKIMHFLTNTEIVTLSETCREIYIMTHDYLDAIGERLRELRHKIFGQIAQRIIYPETSKPIVM